MLIQSSKHILFSCMTYFVLGVSIRQKIKKGLQVIGLHIYNTFSTIAKNTPHGIQSQNDADQFSFKTIKA